MTLSAWQATVQDEDGNIVPSAEISVLIESSGLPATIYSTRGGAALSNPFFADANGFAQFYANKGEYRITANSGVFSNTFRYVRLGDAGAVDVGLGSGQVPTADQLNMVGQTVNYTGANLNPNVFGGRLGRSTLVNGRRTTGDTCLFTPAVMGISGSIPVSITIAGTFSLYNATTVATVATGITNIVLSGATGGQSARIIVNPSIALSTTDIYELRSDTDASTITVNF